MTQNDMIGFWVIGAWLVGAFLTLVACHFTRLAEEEGEGLAILFSVAWFMVIPAALLSHAACVLYDSCRFLGESLRFCWDERETLRATLRGEDSHVR